MTVHPRRRHDDVQRDVDADEVEEFFASLPEVIEGLKRGRRANRRLARLAGVIGLFVLAAFLTVAHAQEKAADQDRQDAYVQCRLVNDNALAINGVVDRAIASVRANPELTPADKRERVAAWEQVKQKLPVCRRP